MVICGVGSDTKKRDGAVCLSFDPGTRHYPTGQAKQAAAGHMVVGLGHRRWADTQREAGGLGSLVWPRFKVK